MQDIGSHLTLEIPFTSSKILEPIGWKLTGKMNEIIILHESLNKEKFFELSIFIESVKASARNKQLLSTNDTFSQTLYFLKCFKCSFSQFFRFNNNCLKLLKKTFSNKQKLDAAENNQTWNWFFKLFRETFPFQMW